MYLPAKTLWSRVILETLLVAHLVEKFISFCGTSRQRRGVCHMSPDDANPSILRCILILSPYPGLDIPSGPFRHPYKNTACMFLLIHAI
jgi:hypothetical protein